MSSSSAWNGSAPTGLNMTWFWIIFCFVAALMIYFVKGITRVRDLLVIPYVNNEGIIERVKGRL